jgi:hypothetical protein
VVWHTPLPSLSASAASVWASVAPCVLTRSRSAAESACSRSIAPAPAADRANSRIAASGRVRGVSLRNTRGGMNLGRPSTMPLQSCVSTVPPASMISSLCGVEIVISCTVLPNPSRNCSGAAQPEARTCHSAMRRPLKGAGVSRRLCTV